MTGAAVRIRGLGKAFREDDWILREVNLDIAPGEMISLIGRSGTGKTTLLRLIAGLEKPTEGSIELDHMPLDGPTPGLGFLVQDYSHSLLPWLRVEGNLRLALLSSDIDKKLWPDMIADALDQVGLSGNARKFPWELSGGMQQRVALARAFIRSPRLLLLDEPFASVDAFVRADLEDLTLSVTRRHHITSILVTHDIDEAIYMGNRVITIGGSPAKNASEHAVRLPEPRSQAITRADRHFVGVRADILKNL